MKRKFEVGKVLEGRSSMRESILVIYEAHMGTKGVLRLMQSCQNTKGLKLRVTRDLGGDQGILRCHA